MESTDPASFYCRGNNTFKLDLLLVSSSIQVLYELSGIYADRYFAAKIPMHMKLTIDSLYHGTKLWTLLISRDSNHFTVCFSIGIPCSKSSRHLCCLFVLFSYVYRLHEILSSNVAVSPV